MSVDWELGCTDHGASVHMYEDADGNIRCVECEKEKASRERNRIKYLKQRAEKAEAERDTLKARVEELEAFLNWTEKDEDWGKSWQQIMKEWKD